MSASAATRNLLRELRQALEEQRDADLDIVTEVSALPLTLRRARTLTGCCFVRGSGAEPRRGHTLVLGTVHRLDLMLDLGSVRMLGSTRTRCWTWF